MFFLKIIRQCLLFAYLPFTLIYAESCQYQVLGFEGRLCATLTFDWDNRIYSEGRTFNTTFVDTHGVITPFNWTNEVFTPLDGSNHGGAARVKSLAYIPVNENSSNCNPMQFTVYNNQGRVLAVEYFTPGKGPSWCMYFLDDYSTFTTYDTVTMLVPGALDRTHVIGDGDEDGYYLVPLCPWAYSCPDINLDIVLDHLQ